jgi:hypothetical protein
MGNLLKNKRGPLKHKPAKVGYKDAESAKETVSKLNNMPRSEARILANTLSNRAKFHQNQTEDMREAKSVIDAWRKKQRDKDDSMAKQEKMEMHGNGQWSLKKWNMEKRCWEGYEPTPGKKAYDKGSCRPIKKDDAPHHPESPEDSAHDVMEEGASLKDEIESLSPEERDDMLAHLRTLKDKRKHRSEENRKIGEDVGKMEVAPKGSNNRKTYLQVFGKSDADIAADEFEVTTWDDGHIDLTFGQDISAEDEQTLVKSFAEHFEELEKKEWHPKKGHKSKKGGLTAAGRASYNKATGGNLKAPQPGGGPRKRSFCARNKGQIKMHGINCKKTPEKRACLARRRWKCTN